MSTPERDQALRNDMRAKIKAGMDSIRVGRTHSAERVKAEMVVFKKKWRKSRS
jgi:hypothetical protein